MSDTTTTEPESIDAVATRIDELEARRPDLEARYDAAIEVNDRPAADAVIAEAAAAATEHHEARLAWLRMRLAELQDDERAHREAQHARIRSRRPVGEGELAESRQRGSSLRARAIKAGSDLQFLEWKGTPTPWLEIGRLAEINPNRYIRRIP